MTGISNQFKIHFKKYSDAALESFHSAGVEGVFVDKFEELVQFLVTRNH